MIRLSVALPALLLFVLPIVSSGDQPLDLTKTDTEVEPVQCPVSDNTQRVPQKKTVHTRATVLIGADVLGRIAIAADYDGDSIVDEEMLFTTITRLRDPEPVVLNNAKVITRTSSVVVESADGSLAVALSVSGSVHEPAPIPKRWRKYSEVVVDEDGIGLYRKTRPDGFRQPLAAYDHNSLYTWYPGFEEELLYVGTGQCLEPGCAGLGCWCNDQGYNCTTGGCGTAFCQCGSPCSGGNTPCGAGYFACCTCRDEGGVFWCTSRCYKCGEVQ